MRLVQGSNGFGRFLKDFKEIMKGLLRRGLVAYLEF
jgi:hypothetical protein